MGKEIERSTSDLNMILDHALVIPLWCYCKSGETMGGEQRIQHP